jgi:Uncharacterised nucleotidyltransferase
MNWQHAMRTDRQKVLQILRDPAVLVTLAVPALDLALRQLRRLRLLARVAERLHAQDLVGQFSPCVRDQMESARITAASQARAARWELKQLERVLEPGPQRPVVALKGGAYLLLDLPFTLGRILSDVDLLVPEQQLAQTEQRLREFGWEMVDLNDYDQRFYREWSHEIPPLRHVERELEVDLHHNVLPRTSRLKPQSALLLQSARLLPHGTLSVLAPADMVLHAMTHLFYSSEQDDALRELVDIDAMLRYFSAIEPEFWQQFPLRAHALDLARPASYALHFAMRWFDTPIPQAVLTAIKPAAAPAFARWLMDKLVPSALFAPHPDRRELAARIARNMLLARSHWIRMPPLLLARHLAVKSVRRWREADSQSA